jgi:hypothetical protein
MAQTRTRKSNPIKFRSSAFEVNQKFVIDTRNPESCLMTLKVKKSSKLGLETSTVGLIRMNVSDFRFDGHYQLEALEPHLVATMRRVSQSPVGTVCKALLGMELKIDGLPEDIPNPAEVERQQHIMKAKRIQRWRIWYRMYQNLPLTWSGSWMSFFTEWISIRRRIVRVGSKVLWAIVR